MNTATKSTLLALSTIIMIAIYGGTFYMGYDAGKESERMKCGVTMHCAPIHKEVNIKAAKYRHFKNCLNVVKEWEDE